MNNATIPATNDTQSLGALQVNLVSEEGHTPITNAPVTISLTGTGQESVLEEATTDDNGQTASIPLPAPSPDYSAVPTSERPYEEYTIEINVPGYEKVQINGVQVLPDVQALQEVTLTPMNQGGPTLEIVIGPHTLYGDYPAKIPETEVKDLQEAGEIVLNQVVVPEIIVVHDGSLQNTNAPNYYVNFKDYIKNVASSEIYATWSESTIQANILAILSFTLNRVYTEWYRNKGYNFTITSSTAYDHKFIYGRNIYRNISQLVDKLFVNYLSRPSVKQPILTQYCDGKQVACLDRGWMTQWGSKALGDQGKNPIEILRNYYGNSMYINTATQVSGIPSSWGGVNLQDGSTGSDVRVVQNQLNAIAKKYPAIPLLKVDGEFGPSTAASVSKFQSIFGLPASGIVDYPTWYKLSEIYVAVSKIAELV